MFMVVHIVLSSVFEDIAHPLNLGTHRLTNQSHIDLHGVPDLPVLYTILYVQNELLDGNYMVSTGRRNAEE